MSFINKCIRCKNASLLGFVSGRYKLPLCRRATYSASAKLFSLNCKYPSHKILINQHLASRNYSSTLEQTDIDYNTFNKVCEETLESLTEYFEELLEKCNNLKTADVSYSSGVLTVHLGDKHGTYVINRQSPNKQIWLSSPTSGPKRYDLVNDDLYWIYKHDGQTLHQLLQTEISQIIKEADFSKCAHSRL